MSNGQDDRATLDDGNARHRLDDVVEYMMGLMGLEGCVVVCDVTNCLDLGFSWLKAQALKLCLWSSLCSSRRASQGVVEV